MHPQQHSGTVNTCSINIVTVYRCVPLTRGQLMAPSCSTRLQNLAQKTTDETKPDVGRYLFLSRARTLSATSAHLQRPTPRRETLETRWWTLVQRKRTNKGCRRKVAVFC